ncbi:MAG TPA: hypothetical protein VF575_03320 [Candidatus Saccharimonadales bacterium]|jgi:hypothetical protein
MATTTIQAFKEFAEKIKPTSNQLETIQTKRSATHNYLLEGFDASDEMPLDRTVIIGSASRDTIIRPLDDIDILAVFSDATNIYENKYIYDSHAFINRVRNVLGQNFTDTVVGTRGQAVRLFYKSGPHVDIAPVFMDSGGGYLLPSGNGGWLKTDPDVQAAWFSEQNKELDYHLRPLVRLLKRWNNEHSKDIKSYHLEVMVANTFKTLGGNSRNAINKFFTWSQSHIDVYDPAGHSGNLSNYLTWNTRRDLIARLTSAAERTQKALDAEDAGDHAEAIRLWRIELGSEFPSYG